MAWSVPVEDIIGSPGVITIFAPLEALDCGIDQHKVDPAEKADGQAQTHRDPSPRPTEVGAVL